MKVTRLGLLCAGCLLFGMLAGALAAGAREEAPADDSKRVRSFVVRCDHGDRIQRILSRNPADELRIEVRGLCAEDVLIERDRVTLFGDDPEEDGIVGTGRSPNAVLIRGDVFDIRIENLTLRGTPNDPAGGGVALGTGASFRVEVIGCRLEGRGVDGAVGMAAFIGDGSSVVMEDTVLTTAGGASTLWVTGGLNGRRLSLSSLDDEARALTVVRGTVGLSDSVLTGRDGVRVIDGFFRIGSDSRITGVAGATGGGAALLLIDDASAEIRDTQMVGAIQAADQSRLLLSDVTQTELQGTAVNRLSRDALLNVFGDTTLAGDLFLDSFSKALVGGTTMIGGDLVCDATSEAVCSGGWTAMASTCGACPLP